VATTRRSWGDTAHTLAAHAAVARGARPDYDRRTPRAGVPIVASVQLALPRTPHAASRARDAADRVAADLPAELRSRLRLVVSELVTNAVRHGEGAIELRLWRDGTTVRGEVVDEGGGFEHEVRREGWDEVGGRGLGIVERMTRRWGIREGTTHVWFELDPGGTGAPRDPTLG
jgi:anti-sigma regulatory factor (Ser/Thr protein kinase)